MKSSVLMRSQSDDGEAATTERSNGDARKTFPAVQLRADADHITVTAQVPGFGPDDLSLSLDRDVLVLEGKHSPVVPIGFFLVRRERSSGSFTRRIKLLHPIEPHAAEASLQHGVLEVRLQRKCGDDSNIPVRAF